MCFALLPPPPPNDIDCITQALDEGGDSVGPATGSTSADRDSGNGTKLSVPSRQSLSLSMSLQMFGDSTRLDTADTCAMRFVERAEGLVPTDRPIIIAGHAVTITRCAVSPGEFQFQTTEGHSLTSCILFDQHSRINCSPIPLLCLCVSAHAHVLLACVFFLFIIRSFN